MQGKKYIVPLVAMLALTSAGCASAKSSGANTRKFTIGYELGAPVPDLISTGEGIKKWTNANGDTYVQNGGQFDVGAQVTAIDALIGEHVNVIAAAIINGPALKPTIEKAESAGIKFIVVGDVQPTATVSIHQDEEATAKQLALNLAAQIKAAGKPCRLLIMQGLPEVAALQERSAGFDAGAKEANCTVLDRHVEKSGSSSEATSIAATWKAKYGSTATGLLADNDPDTIGALATVGSGFQPLIGGDEGTQDALSALASGRIAAESVAPSAFQGEVVAYVASQLQAGAHVPANIEIPTRILTKSTVASWYTDTALLAKPALTIEHSVENGTWTFALPGK